MKTVIIGGVAGGASAAARLRRLDEHMDIVMIEKGPYVSFANCGLPYYIGGAIRDKSALTLQTPESFHSRFRVDVRVQNEAVSIDTEKKTVLIKDLVKGELYQESYDELILSTGAEPIKPPIKGVDSTGVFTIRNIPDTIKITEYMKLREPKSAVVIGGGYIGIELAENLKNAGLDVTIVEAADHVLPPLDYDMAADVHQYLKSKGIHLRMKDGVKEIRSEAGSLTILTQSGAALETDMAILSVGVRPDTALAEKAGIQRDSRGSILVDSRMRTSASHIYAVGDAVEINHFLTQKPAFLPLAGPANKQGRIAADNICGIPSEYTGTQGSCVAKVFDMAVAATGLNERDAKAAGFDCGKVFLLSPSHAGYYPGSTNMSIKVVFEKGTGKILGAQITGFDGVDKRCDVFATAIRFGAAAADLTKLELCYAPPFGSAKDPVNMAGYVIENTLSGKVAQFHWHDIASLPRDGSVTLLDVRTPGEYAQGNIEGFRNIPLDSLREHLSELDPKKPIYVHCRSGQRSYIACRILSGNGFTCYNLSGGYRLYEVIMTESR